MKNLPLTRGYASVVCDCHYKAVAQFKWCALKGNRGVFYGFRSQRLNGKQKGTLLHRFIMNEPVGMSVDHIDGNTMNNQCNNLRVCNQSQNNANQHGAKKGSKSGHKGVYWHKSANKWSAEVVYEKKKHYLGVFKNKLDAVEAYNQKAKELHGEFYSEA